MAITMNGVTLGIPHPGAEGYTKPRGLLVVAPAGCCRTIFEIFKTGFFFFNFYGRFRVYYVTSD